MKISSISKKINGNFIGSNDIDVFGFSSFKNIQENTIIFVSNLKVFNAMNTSKLSEKTVLLVGEDLKYLSREYSILLSMAPEVDFAKISYIFNLKKSLNNVVKSNFCMDDSSSIGSNHSFGFNVIIEENVIIGDNVTLGNNVVISRGTSIGNDVFIDSGTVIGSEGFGNLRDSNCKWIHIYHQGNVVIKDNVSIGANCTIDRGTIEDTIISSGVIIDNQVHIAHNVIIESDTAIAANTGIAGSCHIGKRNMIGGMVGIVDHISTADDVIISATSTVFKDIKEPGVYTGILPISKHTKWKRIALWITKVDKIAKFLNIKKI